jgi:hypothetical protein
MSRSSTWIPRKLSMSDCERVEPGEAAPEAAAVDISPP